MGSRICRESSMFDTATLKSPDASAPAAVEARRKARMGIALSILGMALSLAAFAVLLGRHSLADRGEQTRGMAPRAPESQGAPAASGSDAKALGALPAAPPRPLAFTRSAAAAASADR
jgi:hypothetical protein